MVNRNKPSVLRVSDQSGNSGKIAAVLLIYIATFLFTLIIFLHGYHSLALLILITVWGILVLWVKGGR